MHWVGQSTRCAVTWPYGATGHWCAVPSRSVGGIWGMEPWMHPDGRMMWERQPVKRVSPRMELAGGKNQEGAGQPRPGVCWPAALRKVRAWLEPWLMLGRYWRAWSLSPPPPELQALLTWVQRGFPLYLYEPL